MFSADLYKSEILGVRRLVAKEQPSLGKLLGDINKYLLGVGKKVEGEGDGSAWIDPKMPEDILPKLDKFLREAERVLTRSAASSFFEELMELYFSILSFTRIAELYDAHYTTYAEKQQKEVYLRLYNCLLYTSPSPRD